MTSTQEIIKAIADAGGDADVLCEVLREYPNAIPAAHYMLGTTALLTPKLHDTLQAEYLEYTTTEARVFLYMCRAISYDASCLKEHYHDADDWTDAAAEEIEDMAEALRHTCKTFEIGG
jgi:hypothetical protein